MSESGREGVDILLTGQWPLNISGVISDAAMGLDQQKKEFYSGSESLQRLIVELSPRYVYSSH